MFDIISVGIIVGVASFLAVKSIYKTVTGKASGCGKCGERSCCSRDVSIMDKLDR